MTAFDTAAKLRLVEQFRRSKVANTSRRDEVTREASDLWPSHGWEAIEKAAQTWNPRGGKSEKNYYWVGLEYAWGSLCRAVREQRSMIPKGHRRDAEMRFVASLPQNEAPYSGGVPSHLQGRAPKSVQWRNHPPYTRAMHTRVAKEIGPVVKHGFFGLTPYKDLSPRQAEAVGRRVFGQRLEQAAASWDHDDYDDVLFCILREQMSSAELCELMSPPCTKAAARKFLSEGCQRLGTTPDGLVDKIFDGIRHTRIRSRIEAEERDRALGFDRR